MSGRTPLPTAATHQDAASVPPDFGPSASLNVLRLRAEMLHWLRTFFRDRGYWEVETPLLSHDVCVDAWLEPYCVARDGNADDGSMLYLQTSPEFGMKRLLVAGAESIFQITRAFRQEERGRLHNPEFTMVEWYRVGDTYDRQMDFVEEMAAGFQKRLRELADVGMPDPDRFHNPLPMLECPVRRLTYEDAFQVAVGERVLNLPVGRLIEIAHERGIDAPGSLDRDDRDGWLNLLFLESVEPVLAEHPAAFVCDYPASQSALARIRPDEPPVAERFELFLKGVEICNGYQELTDPAELRERISVQQIRRQRAKRADLPEESRLLTAMEAGLPPCAGVALGFDRLLMVLLGAESLSDVVAFPIDRA